MKKAFLALFAVAALMSCEKDSENVVAELLDIKNQVTPTGATVNQNVTLTFKAVGPNLCYSLDDVDITPVNNFRYKVRALARVQKGGVCAQALYQKDTSVVFKPTAAGKYYFEYLSRNNQSVLDSMIVQ